MKERLLDKILYVIIAISMIVFVISCIAFFFIASTNNKAELVCIITMVTSVIIMFVSAFILILTAKEKPIDYDSYE